MLISSSEFEETVLTAEKTWMRELEADGHIACAVRKQRQMKAGAQLTVAFLLGPGSHTWNEATYSSYASVDGFWKCSHSVLPR